MQGFVTFRIFYGKSILHPLCIEQPLKIHNPEVMIECLLMAREKNFLLEIAIQEHSIWMISTF
jgi:hypothetical protein